MKKLIAIFMLAIFTFNIAGYQLVFNYISNKADTNLELALDQDNYNDEDLITIKQPTNLPYYNNTQEFQRINGEVEMNGVKYRYVKCRIYNGNLEMLCIPHRAKMQIEQSKNDYAKVANDFQQNDTEKKDGQTKSFQKSLSEYEEQSMIVIDCGSQLLTTNYVLASLLSSQPICLTTTIRRNFNV